MLNIKKMEEGVDVEDSIGVCAKIGQYDMSINDSVDEDSKSYPREGIVCFTCKAPLVVSNMMFEKQKTAKMQFLCLEHMVEFIKKELLKHE